MTVLVSDSFNRADITNGLGTTDSYNGGTAKSWVTNTNIVSSTWGIISNAAYCATGQSGSRPNLAWVDCGVSDVSITVKMGTLNGQYPIALRVSQSNYTGIVVTPDGKIQSFSGTAYTTIASSGVTINTGDTVNLKAQGNALTLTVNGTQVLTTTSTINQTLTTHGLANWRSGSANGTWDSFQIEDLNTGGTNASITSVIANANANGITPTVSADNTIQSVIASAQVDALVPQVGSFTNINISATTPNATASAINPITSTTSNISLGAPISNAVASALVPNVGLSQSATISAVIASLVVDGIAPNISTSQGTSINSVVAGANASAMSPTIQRDLILYAGIANSQASALSPNINGKLLVSKIYLNANRSLTINLKANQSKQVNLKGAIT